MTLTTTHNRITYTGNGVVTVYPYTFLILAATDLLVYHDDVLQTSGYTVSGVGTGSGGNVTYGTAPADDVAILFVRATDQTQQVNLIEGDALPADSVEGMFDKAYAAVQDLAGTISRSVQLDSASELETVMLPNPGAGQFIRWNAAGTELEVATIQSSSVVSPIVAAGDLIRGGVGAAPERLAIGTAGYILTVVSGLPAWAVPPAVPASPIPTGTQMLFDQDSAPSGWTRVLTTNDRMVRIVSGIRSDGGSWTISGFTVASHTHAGVDHLHYVPAVGTGYAGGESGSVVLGGGGTVTGVFHTHTTGATYTGGSDRSLTTGAASPSVSNNAAWRPLHRDVIVCTKD